MDKWSYIIFILITALMPISGHAETFSQWLSNNETIVKNYVSNLQPNDKLKGVTLTNGQTYLTDFVYVRKINLNRKGTDIHLLVKDHRYLAIIWLSSDALPLAIPQCPKGSEWVDQPWSRASLISGDVYKFENAKPGFSLVINYCPAEDWISDSSKSR